MTAVPSYFARFGWVSAPQDRVFGHGCQNVRVIGQGSERVLERQLVSSSEADDWRSDPGVVGIENDVDAAKLADVS